MAIVETRHLSKSFGDVTAVDRIDLATREGEFLVLLGPSGCGKSTLLRMIAGLEEPSAGDVLIGGRVVNELAPGERNIAMVFQSYALYPHLTVARNIAFPLRARHMPRDQIPQKVQWAASMFDIERLLHRKPRELSGGERQRVALARALVRDPQVFLLDEPLSNLDAKLRNSARDDLQEFQRRVGTTTIYVTHDQVEAMGLGQRVAVLNDGRVHQIGKPQEVYNDPADTFVAAFLGSPPMNLLRSDGTITGFRPEHFLPLEAARGEGERDQFDFQVARVEYLGSDRLVYGTLGGMSDEHKVIAKLPTTVTVAIEQGHTHRFGVLKQFVRRFDAASGRRLAN
jgi:multiple sugar transport system ATP-binding protein